MAAAEATAVESTAAEAAPVESTTAAKTAAVESTAAKPTAHVAAAKCQGGTARSQRRAQRGRGQQYTEASHRSLLTFHSNVILERRPSAIERSRFNAVYGFQ